MPWKDLNSGQVTDYYPPTGNQSGGVNNIIHVPENPVYRPQYRTGTPDTFVLGQALAADPRFGKFLRGCLLLVACVLALFVLYAFVVTSWDKLLKADIAAHKGKPVIWKAGTLEWSSKLFHQSGQPVELGGPDAIVTGDINGLKLDAVSNLTVKGEVTNSSLTAYDTLVVGNVSNSVLRAHKIVISGRAVNAKKIILRPYQDIPLSKRPH